LIKKEGIAEVEDLKNPAESKLRYLDLVP